MSIERPRPWSGEGLPPTDSMCEIRNISVGSMWAKATIKFASRNVIVWEWDGDSAVSGLCTAYRHAVELRPIRDTAEQIAAEERENTITDICVTMDCNPNSDYVRSRAAILYDAGYRKQVQP